MSLAEILRLILSGSGVALMIFVYGRVTETRKTQAENDSYIKQIPTLVTAVTDIKDRLAAQTIAATTTQVTVDNIQQEQKIMRATVTAVEGNQMIAATDMAWVKRIINGLENREEGVARRKRNAD